MPVPRSSPARSKPAAAKAAVVKRTRAAAGKPVAASKPTQRAVARRGRGKAAEMLHEIQLDAEALSVRLERLRHRFP